MVDDGGIQGVLLMKWTQFFGMLGGIIVLAGMGAAYMSTLSPSRKGFFERSGGILFIAGLALLGFTFPLP
jgi:hypothetical protein